MESKVAYLKARRKDRQKAYMEMPALVKEYDADGTEMVVEFNTPIWGEKEAGFEWDEELHTAVLDIGWKQCPGVNAMYYFEGADGNECRMVKIVDDLGFSEANLAAPIIIATVKELKLRYNDQVTVDFNPTSFAGLKIEQAKDLSWLRISQPEKVIDAVTELMPDIMTAPSIAPYLMSDAKLDGILNSLELVPTIKDPTKTGTAAMPKLNPNQKRVQKIIGYLKYFERGTMIRITERTHKLSCIMSNPPVSSARKPNDSDALSAAEAVLALAYKHRYDFIQYGDHGPQPSMGHDGRVSLDMTKRAPFDLDISCDASAAPRPVWSVLVTKNGGAVLHVTKNVGAPIASIMEGEGIASIKASEYAIYARIVEVALGNADVIDTPTRLLTDNLGNMQVAGKDNSSARSRYYLIRYACLKHRTAEGQVRVLYVPDKENPSDFLTKSGIGKMKIYNSLYYATGMPVPDDA